MSAPEESARGARQSKREAILQAAVRLFHRYGFRRTSIDLIAGEAQVAKPTVYAHFADKDALFAAVCEYVMEDVLARAEEARRSSKPVAERLAAMLAAKFTFLFGLVDASPHAAELLDSSQSALAGRIVADADARFVAALTSEIRRAVRAKELTLTPLGLDPSGLARMLMQGAHGAGYEATSTEEHRQNLDRLVSLLLAGAIPKAAVRREPTRRR